MLEMIFEVVLKVEVAEMRFNSRAAQVCQVAPEENERHLKWISHLAIVEV